MSEPFKPGNDPYRSPQSDLGKQASRRWPKWVAAGLALSAIPVALYSLYAAVFFIWVADTNESVELRAQAIRYGNAWATAFLLSLASAIALVVWLIYVTTKTGRTP